MGKLVQISRDPSLSPHLVCGVNPNLMLVVGGWRVLRLAKKRVMVPLLNNLKEGLREQLESTTVQSEPDRAGLRPGSDRAEL